jgi:ATP-dependent Clp protease ATP-binding subunit ClpA
MTPDLISKLNSLGSVLESNILGQTEPLAEVVSLLQRSMCGLRFPGRPIASMLFLGPTGVGKTETVNLFTKHLFGGIEKLVRLDMSEFMNQSALDLLVGKSVGDIGLLGHYVERSGGSGVMLFDEIDKAHPFVLDIFLQILSAARFTLATGETLDLSNYVIVATTNIGAQMLMQSRTTDRETIIKNTIRDCTHYMRPETFARFDLHSVFNKLNGETLNKIGILHTVNVLNLMREKGHSFLLDDQVFGHIQRAGYSEKFGARPMQNSAMRVIGDIVAAQMLKDGGLPVRGTIRYDRKQNKCYFHDESITNPYAPVAYDRDGERILAPGQIPGTVQREP